MAGSQLKQLKASLRERGRLGPTPSKKEKKARQDRRQAAIPDQVPAKKAKFEFVNGSDKKDVKKDSAASEQREQARRDGILHEMHRKQKVGGIIDRRFGEDNPDMTPEDRAMERFVREKQRSGRKSNIFDLDAEDDDEDGLTHMGRPLGSKDDFQESVSDDVSEEGEERGKKRRRLSNEEAEIPMDQAEADPDRPRTKKEIMEEVIAKSKLYKHERQQAKEDDDDLRAKLDAGVGDIFALLGGKKAAVKIAQPADIPMNPGRAAILNGHGRQEADKQYDLNLRSMIQDKRSQPTTRTKTEEERAADEAARLQKLEQQRLRRMAGEESEDEDGDEQLQGDEDFGHTDSIGVTDTNKPRALLRDQNVEEEDEFDLDGDLVASDSDLEDLGSGVSSVVDEEGSDNDDTEFVADLLTKDDAGRLELTGDADSSKRASNGTRNDIAFTYPCPKDLQEIISLTEDVPLEDIPTVVQRIRALYHPGLAEGNKERLSVFAAVLVAFIPHIAQDSNQVSPKILESLIRHTHSLAKSYPESVSEAMREQLRLIQKTRPTALTTADMVLLTAVGHIYPTSDHFHQVVTPAILTMTRYLEHATSPTLSDLVQGTFISALLLMYQKLSKRYVPEVLNYSLNTLSMLCPRSQDKTPCSFPRHKSSKSLRIQTSQGEMPLSSIPFSWLFRLGINPAQCKLTIVMIHLDLIQEMPYLWKEKSAYPEIMQPFIKVLDLYLREDSQHFLPESLLDKITLVQTNLKTSITTSLTYRRPLTLHSHRPLAIKQSVPKFEESYNPHKRYDPDAERSESNKLRAEHKKERKAVIREFRKEGRAEAAVQLEEKKARDEAYEKKQRRLIAEIQGEEGFEANKYEREKEGRKRGR